MTEEQLIKILKEFRRIEPSHEAYEKGLALVLQKVLLKNRKKQRR